MRDIVDEVSHKPEDIVLARGLSHCPNVRVHIHIQRKHQIVQKLELNLVVLVFQKLKMFVLKLSGVEVATEDQRSSLPYFVLSRRYLVVDLHLHIRTSASNRVLGRHVELNLVSSPTCLLIRCQRQ